MFVKDVFKEARTAAGTCDQETVFTMLTQAIEIISKKANFDPAVGIVDICSLTDGQTITLPREVETPLAVRVGTSPKIFRNRWSEFHINGNGGEVTGWHWDDAGFVPCVMDIIDPSYLISISELKSDLEKPIRVFGYDENNIWIRSQLSDGTWIDGFYIYPKLITDFAGGIMSPDSTRIFERIFTIQKPTVFNTQNSDNHSFTTGAVVRVNLIASPLPSPIVNGADYFVGSAGDKSVKLYLNRSNALTGTSPIEIDSASGTSIINLSDIRGVAVQTKFNSSSAHNITTGMRVELSGSTLPTPFLVDVDYFASRIDANNFALHLTKSDAENGLNPVDAQDAGSSVVALAKQDCYPYTTLNFSVNHDMQQGDVVRAQSSVGQLPSPLVAGVDYFVRVITSTCVTLHTSLADASSGSNPIVMKDGGSGTLSIYKTMLATAGLGNTSNMNCTNHQLTTGAFVQFSTTGTYPSPITEGTVYKVATPSSTNTFSLTDTSDSAVNITNLGTGQLSLIVSRTFTIGFTNNWETITAHLSTGSVVKMDATGSLPSCTPSIDSLTNYYVRVNGDTSVGLYPTLSDAQNDTNKIVVNSVGSGVVSLVIQRSVDLQVYSSNLKIADSTYFTDGSTIRFETTDTLPSPLSTSTDYLGYIVDGELQVKLPNGNAVTLTTIGEGLHNMLITKNFTVDIDYKVIVSDNEYNDGDEVEVISTGTPPSPLSNGSSYYVRYKDNDTIEFYDSSAHAINTSSDTGKVIITNSGTGVHSIIQEKAAFMVSKVERISKESTNGIQSLYAWDSGRTDNITTLGVYHSDETSPMYRRIKIASVCPYARIAYRKSMFQIKSMDDFIPLNSTMAISLAISAVKSYKNGFTDIGDKYMTLAERFLLEDDKARSGPEVVSIQINDSIAMNTEDIMT